jgi:hypothetical protein
MKNRIFSMDSAKAIKARGFGYLNAIHYMAPATLAGVGNLCPKATESCKALCLGWYSGQASMVAHETDLNSVRQSRIDKARRFMTSRAEYMRDIVRSIENAEKAARRKRLKLCVRLNGSTDIAWEGIACERGGVKFRSVYEAFPHIQFVDYTKIAARLIRPLPSNLHLTLSRTEKNESDAAKVLAARGNVAVVFRGKFPRRYLGARVINGDEHDLRHLDPKGVVVGLSPKGSKAKRDRSGFVVEGVAA